METDSLPREDSFVFWKNLVLVALFFLAAPLTILTASFSLVFLYGEKTSVVDKELANAGSPKGVQVFASLPSESPSIGGVVFQGDARAEVTRLYLESYNSPLINESQALVDAADHYNLDYRLLTAIAQQESNLCKRIPAGTHNCWGWGIHSEGTLGFGSYKEAIWAVSKGIKEDYIDRGLTTPELIMTRYTPQSPNGSWFLGVSQFMDELDQL